MKRNMRFIFFANRLRQPREVHVALPLLSLLSFKKIEFVVHRAGFPRRKALDNQHLPYTMSYSTLTPLFILLLLKFTRVGNNKEMITLWYVDNVE